MIDDHYDVLCGLPMYKRGCKRLWKEFLHFPKMLIGGKNELFFFCKRESFVPTKSHRNGLCSEQFTKNQLQSNPVYLERLSFKGAMTRLKADAVPEVPLPIQTKENNNVVHLFLPAKPRA